MAETRSPQSRRAKRDRISFDVLSPLTIGRMVRGSTILEQLQNSTDKSVTTVTVQGAEIKRVLLRTGRKYYRRGIQLYLNDKIIDRVHAGLQRSVATLREALAISADAVFSDQWLDVGGQLMPRQRLLDLYESVETGKITEIEALETQLSEIHDAYAEDEWLWVTKVFQQTSGVDLNQAGTDDIRSIADAYLQTRKEFLQLILLDASKEYHEQSQVGFGVDPEAQSADFHAVPEISLRMNLPPICSRKSIGWSPSWRISRVGSASGPNHLLEKRGLGHCTATHVLAGFHLPFSDCQSKELKTMSDVAQRVKQVVARTLKVDPSRVVEQARFVEDLGAESMQSIELVAAFEEEFDVDMDEQAALGVKNVGDAVRFIDNIVND